MSALRLLLVVAALGFCLPLSAASRVYDVDPAYRDEIVNILQRLLDTDREQGRTGEVEVLPNGQILVDTLTDARQDEVAAIFEAIARNRPAGTPSVTLRYWLIGGDPDAGTAPPPLLSGVLSELTEVHGPQTFRVLASATVTGSAGDGAYYANPPWVIDQTANLSGERLNAEIYVSINLLSQWLFGRVNVTTDPDVPEGQVRLSLEPVPGAAPQPPVRALEVEVSFTPGQFLVLGSGAAPGTEEGGVTAIVVQWPGAE